MTINPNGLSRPITEALYAAHDEDTPVVKDGQELTLGALRAFEAMLCKAPEGSRNDLADARFVARLLGPNLHPDFVHLIEVEEAAD